jgi:hypothetical protein
MAGVQLRQSGWPIHTLHIMTDGQQQQQQQQHQQQRQVELAPAAGTCTEWEAVDKSGAWQQLWEAAQQQNSKGSSGSNGGVMQQRPAPDSSSRAWVQLVLVRPDGHVAWRHQQAVVEAALQQQQQQQLPSDSQEEGAAICQLRTVLQRLHQKPSPATADTGAPHAGGDVLSAAGPSTASAA